MNKSFLKYAAGILMPAVVVFGSCRMKSDYRFEEGIAWNTLYHITYDSPSDLSDSISRIFVEIDASLSPFNPESTVSKINDNRTESVDNMFREVYHASSHINRESGGLFDPTLAPLIRAWGFGQGHEVNADTLKIDSLLNIVGISKTTIQGTRIIKENSSTEFNFSALAKGYGVDCIADMLERNGVNNYLVEVGGEIRASGVNPKGNKWSIGIDRPLENGQPGDAVTTLYVNEAAVATSGNYRNFHDRGGKRFGHTISPETGRPVQTDVISATVVAPSCMEADALATCCMVMGSEKALPFCTGMRVGVMLILEDMSVVSNAAFNAFTGQSGEPGKEDRD